MCPSSDPSAESEAGDKGNNGKINMNEVKNEYQNSITCCQTAYITTSIRSIITSIVLDEWNGQ